MSGESESEFGVAATASAIRAAVERHPDFTVLEMVIRLAASVKGTDRAFRDRGAAPAPDTVALLAEATAWTQAEWLRIARVVCNLPPTPAGEGETSHE